MLGQALDQFFLNSKFNYSKINDHIRTYAVEEENNLKVCVIVNNTTLKKYSYQDLSELEMKIRINFSSKGHESLDILFLLYTDDIYRDRKCTQYMQVWLLDVKSKKVIIYTNQPQRFNNIDISIERIAFEENNIKHKLPVCSIVIILINIIVFIFLELFGSTIDPYYMLKYGASSWQNEFVDMEVYRLFTCMFLHFGAGHLINNMIMLYLVGSQIEGIYGGYCFLSIYLSSGLIANTASSVFNMIMGRDEIVSAGASGAIYGLLGAMVVTIWYNRKRIAIFIYRLLIVFVIIGYSGFTDASVDNVAHIAGFIAGIIIGIIIYRVINNGSKLKPS